ncbi:MAG TPA: putative inorganic carbon transporter subunit DabA, partial [Gemmataceae bacterium]|nr:putative inorganic carbon transporter subunit DabA [Gemmataceae bacterium]
LAMLQNPLPTGADNELRWYLEEADALRKVRPGTAAADRAHLIAETRHWVMRDLRVWDATHQPVPGWVPGLFAKFDESAIESWDETTWEAFSLEALYGVCRDGVERSAECGMRNAESEPSDPTSAVGSAFRIPHSALRRHRDLLLSVAGVDKDLSVHGVMIRFCAAFLDQGISHWLLPDRDRGFLHAFCTVYRGTAGPPDRWFRGVRAELARVQDAGTGPLELLAESLAVLGVAEAEWGEYLSATLLALRGWGGIIHEAEERPDGSRSPSRRTA